MTLGPRLLGCASGLLGMWPVQAGPDGVGGYVKQLAQLGGCPQPQGMSGLGAGAPDDTEAHVSICPLSFPSSSSTLCHLHTLSFHLWGPPRAHHQASNRSSGGAGPTTRGGTAPGRAVRPGYSCNVAQGRPSTAPRPQVQGAGFSRTAGTACAGCGAGRRWPVRVCQPWGPHRLPPVSSRCVCSHVSTSFWPLQ